MKADVEKIEPAANNMYKICRVMMLGTSRASKSLTICLFLKGVRGSVEADSSVLLNPAHFIHLTLEQNSAFQ